MAPTRDHVPALYTELATEYDRVYGEKDYAAEVEFVLTRCSEMIGTHPERALLVGCGTGRHARHLIDAGVDVLGIDPNPSMLAVARRTAPEARFRSGRLPDLAVDITAPFDLIWLPFTVINYLRPAELAPAIGTLTDHLTDTGVFVVDNGQFPTDRDVEFDLIDGREGGCCRFYGFERLNDTRIRMALLFVFPPDRFVADSHTLTPFEDATVRGTLSAAGVTVDRYGWYVDEPPAVDGPSVFVGSREKKLGF
ncbi:MAG: class I SAM-dependent methyltransferase [Halobacteriales archaeon]